KTDGCGAGRRPGRFDVDRQGRARGGDGSMRQRGRSPFRRGDAQGCVGARAGLGRERPSRCGGRLTSVDGRAARSDCEPRDLEFEGLCTFADPPKATAPAAVARLAAAGVRVVILSGDDPLVVGRLAKIVGLRAQQAIVGVDLHVLSTDALRVQTRDTDVFARLSPDQKVRIVHALRDAGEIVGFMGDGVNDAPGIKAADIGLSVDDATGVARAAADMILLDSDLAVVADGVEEGRRTFANILKYIRMGASSNFGNMLSMAAASLFLPFLPMLATQILLNNPLYDVSEIGIPFDNVRATDIAQPQRWRMQDIMRFAGVMGPLSSVFDLVTFGALFLWFRASPEVFRTGWFVESITTQTLVIFIIRTRGGPWRDLPNPVLTISTLAALALPLVIPFSPLGEWFGFHDLPPLVIIALAGIVVVYLVSAELFKPLAIISSRLETGPGKSIGLRI